MAMINVDLSNTEAAMGGSSLIAPGDYSCRIVKTEAKRNKNNTGNVLVIDFETTGGDIVKNWISYEHENEKTQNTGKGQLKLLLECVGKTPNDLVRGTEIMHGIPMTIKVAIEDSSQLKDDGTPFQNNVVKKFMPAMKGASKPQQPANTGWGDIGGGSVGTGDSVPF